MVYRNGRNQESSAEAVNAYYATYLMGLALNSTSISDLGLALLAHEIQGAHIYWQIPKSSAVYPRTENSYASSRTVVGIMWQNLIQYSTWFGMDPVYVHGIQHLPYVPASSVLLRYEWVKDEYEAWSTPGDKGWIVTQLCNLAVVDSATAWKTALSYDDSYYDANDAGSNGHSRLNTLHWIATQPPAPAL